MSAHSARCHGCGETYDLGHVKVTGRYADCDMWEAPCCGRQADSRMAWGGPPYRRMGYDDLRVLERERLADGGWL